MTYKYELCGKEVDKIPKFKGGECPEDVQHYFREIVATVKKEIGLSDDEIGLIPIPTLKKMHNMIINLRKNNKKMSETKLIIEFEIYNKDMIEALKKINPETEGWRNSMKEITRHLNENYYLIKGYSIKQLNNGN